MTILPPAKMNTKFIIELFKGKLLIVSNFGVNVFSHLIILLDL